MGCDLVVAELRPALAAAVVLPRSQIVRSFSQGGLVSTAGEEAVFARDFAVAPRHSM